MTLLAKMYTLYFRFFHSYVGNTLSLFFQTWCICCTQFVSLHKLQNALNDLAELRVSVRVTFRSEICKWGIHNFDIAQHILQITQIDKLHTTYLHVRRIVVLPACH